MLLFESVIVQNKRDNVSPGMPRVSMAHVAQLAELGALVRCSQDNSNSAQNSAMRLQHAYAYAHMEIVHQGSCTDC